MHDDLITTTRDVKIDLTRSTECDRLVNEEIEHYSAIDVTNDLLEGGIFTHDCWSFCFQYLARTLFHTSFDEEVAARANQIDCPRILSTLSRARFFCATCGSTPIPSSPSTLNPQYR